LARRLAWVLALAAGCHVHPEPEPSAPEVGEVAGATWMPSVTPGSEVAEPAISLTASDGTGLRLVDLRARAWVDAPLALTELHLTFENPQDRILEGTFAIQLPSRSAISRFAMKIADSWQEGEVVERQAARRVFEDFLHIRQDPALLEHDAGERFTARVFPIPARGRKQLVITYSQELAGTHADYRLPLAGLPALDNLDVRVLGPDPRDAGKVIDLYTAQENAGELVLREEGAAQDVALRSGNLALARITVAGEARPAAGPPPSVTVLFDTSASQAARFPDKVANLVALVERLAAVYGAKQPVRIWCYDNEAVEVYRGTAGGFSPEHAETVLRRRALGASDLVGALAAIRAGARAGERVVIFGDGVATAGATEAGALSEGVRLLRKAGVVRVDAVLTGGNRDLSTMTRLVTTDAGSNTGVVIDGSLAMSEVVEKLRRPTFSGVRVSVPGSRWTWPDRLDGVQQGDTVLVYADLPEDHDLRVELGGVASPRLVTRTTVRPLLERAWVGARIDRLLALRGELAEGDDDMRRVLREQVVELSRKYRVLSPFTSLLVLETENDYRRYGIRRDALTEILAVGDDGPQLLRRDGGKLYVTRDGKATKELEEAAGAPSGEPPGDGDGDGLTDGDDRCPTVPETLNGYQDEDGCPDEIPTQLARFTGVIKGIFFGDDSAKIKERSAPVLDRAIEVLREFTTIRLEISGHSSTGEEPGVSGRRAKVVRDYFISKGIDPERLMVRDAGVNEPVDTNKTAAGRAKNRRIEFTINVDTTQPAQTLKMPEPRMVEIPALSGKFADVIAALAKDRREALVLASKWCDREPGNVLAMLALGEVLAATGDRRGAARAYGSLIDLYPSRADLRRHAGQRLATLGDVGISLAIDSYARAVEQRPDHPTGHRLYAHALASAGRPVDAFAAIISGLEHGSSRPRAGVDEVLRADAAVLAAALIAYAPDRREVVVSHLQRWGIVLPQGPSTSFVLTWETDANDVDLHVIDRVGERASYVNPRLNSGGRLVADVTNGYGPEMFTIAGTPRGYPYTLEAHYFGQGPMGYGMGTLQVIEHDGKGRVRVDERPFVIMNAGARVPLGPVTRPRQ